MRVGYAVILIVKSIYIPFLLGVYNTTEDNASQVRAEQHHCPASRHTERAQHACATLCLQRLYLLLRYPRPTAWAPSICWTCWDKGLLGISRELCR